MADASRCIFVQLTDQTGNPLVLNLYHLVSLKPVGKDLTEVRLTSGAFIIKGEYTALAELFSGGIDPVGKKASKKKTVKTPKPAPEAKKPEPEAAAGEGDTFEAQAQIPITPFRDGTKDADAEKNRDAGNRSGAGNI